MPETAYFIAFWYAIVLFAPPSIGCVVGLILKRLRQWRDLRETMPLDWMPAAP